MEYNEDEAEQSSEEDWLDTKWSTADSSALSCSESKDMAGEQKSIAACDTENSASLGRDGSNQLMSRMQLNDNKAGMEGLDKVVINQIIYEASKGSKFFENEKKKEEQVQHRIQEQEKCRQKITEAELKRGLDEADKLISQLKANLDLSQTIVHVDMDAFYAAVEMRDDPSLRDKPMAVGGIGMLSTSNYEARKFGVRAAMPGFIGRKLCPQLVIVPPNFSKYTAVSRQIREVFAEYDPGFCPISLDEAYLSFTDHMKKRLFYSPVQRTYLRRCQSPPDISLCCCDLNCTIGPSLLESKSLETDVQMLKSVADVSETTCRVEENSFRIIKGCLNAVSSSTNSHMLSSSLDRQSSAQDTEVQDKSASHSADSAHCILLSSASFSKFNENKHQEMMPGCNKKGEDQESKMEKDLNNKQPGTGMICPACCKKIPAYEVITFGTDVESAVQEMRCRIEQRTLLTASAGIASNMMLAKVCSDQNKPNGQFFLPPDYNTIMEFVCKLPIRKISGIGRVTEQLLRALGITHCSDLYCQRALLYHLYSSVSFNYFMRIACGIGSVHVARDEDRKSMSTEQTFRELSQPKELYSKCLELCQNLASDLASKGLLGKTVSLKLKTVDFQVRTRAHTLSSYTNDSETIFSVAKSILQTEIQAELPKILRLRLMGVRMAKLILESECPRHKQETIMGFLNKGPSEKIIKDQKRPNYMRDSLFEKNPDSHFPVECSSRPKQISGDFDHNATSNEHQEKACTDEFPGGKRVTSPGMTLPYSGASEIKSLEKKTSESFVRDDLDKDSECQDGTTEVTKVQGVDACSTQINKAEGTSCPKMPEQDSTVLEMCSFHTLQSQVEDSPVHVALRKKMHSSCGAEGNCSHVDDVGVCLNEKTTLKASSMAQNIDGQISTQCFSTAEGHEPSAMSLLAKSPTSAQHSQDTYVFPSQSVHEPILLCPVCFKHVNCVNLVDFNAHIDKCLLGGTSPNFSQSSDCSQKKNKPKDLSSQKPRKQATEKRSSKAHKRLTELHTRSKPEAMLEESRAGRSHDVLSEGNGGFDSSNSTSTGVCVHGDGSSLSKEFVEYMVCPLCGAERSDWTLGSFNQHVDTCLNRDAISQILQEQKHSDEQHRKRPMNSKDNELFSQGAVKRAKKTPPPKNGKTILSFFKS